MTTARKTAPAARPLAALLATALLVVSLPVFSVSAQDQDDFTSERRQAFQFLNESKFTEALPIFEKLAEAHPSDGGVLFGLGFSLLGSALNVKEPAARRQMRLRARAALLHARELGVKDDLLDSILDGLPPDGSDSGAFSRIKEADDAMREGEAAYARNDPEKAIAAYEHAFSLDPKLYEAALFAGDVYFKQGIMDKAGEWFMRAIAINPDRETAHRYWGDALLAEGKMDEARMQFIEAIIAEPYGRLSWDGLIKWAQRAGVRLAHPKIEPKSSASLLKDNTTTTITIDPAALGNTDGSSAWILYGMERALWPAKKFAQAYPNEKTYRHTLREETEALHLVAVSAREMVKGHKTKLLDPSLESLIKLDDEGLLGAYILLARADEGIAQDYAAYRKENRDKLRRYLTEYVAPIKAGEKP